MTSSQWPFGPFIAVRGAQLFFALVVLGLSGYIGAYTSSSVASAAYYWAPWFNVATALLTLIGVGMITISFFAAGVFTAPLICLIIDAFLFIFWTTSLGGSADQGKYTLQLSSCTYSYYSSSYYSYGRNSYSTTTDSICASTKGGMAMIVLEFLLFLGSVIWSAWWLYRENSGKIAGGGSLEAGQVSMGAISGAPQPYIAYPTQQQQPPIQYPQAQQYPYPPQQQPQQYIQTPVSPGI